LPYGHKYSMDDEHRSPYVGIINNL